MLACENGATLEPLYLINAQINAAWHVYDESDEAYVKAAEKHSGAFEQLGGMESRIGGLSGKNNDACGLISAAPSLPTSI